MSNNEVRQVLMNELGLTRESVRGLAAEIVQATVQRQLEHPGYIEKLVRIIVQEELRKILSKPGSYASDPLADLVRSAAHAAAKELLNQRIKIEVVVQP